MMFPLNRFSMVLALSLFVIAPVAVVCSPQISFAEEKHDEPDSDKSDAAGDVTATENDEDQEHGEHHLPPLLSFEVGSAVCNLAIFLGVFAILSKFVWPTILGGLKAREEKIHADLEGAEQANVKAQELLNQYQVKLDEAAGQVQTMLADARKDAEATGQRIVDEAKAEADRQRERAVADIETAKKVALADLAGQTSDMAIRVAGQVVGRELNANDHAELIRKSLDSLPSDN